MTAGTAQAAPGENLVDDRSFGPCRAPSSSATSGRQNPSPGGLPGRLPPRRLQAQRRSRSLAPRSGTNGSARPPDHRWRAERRRRGGQSLCGAPVTSVPPMPQGMPLNPAAKFRYRYSVPSNAAASRRPLVHRKLLRVVGQHDQRGCGSAPAFELLVDTADDWRLQSPPRDECIEQSWSLRVSMSSVENSCLQARCLA